MKRRKFIINTGLGALSLYFAPTLTSCSNKNALNLNTILGESSALLSAVKIMSKEGNENFGYYQIDKDNFILENYSGKEVFVFYKNAKIVGYRMQIEGDDFFKQNIEQLSKSLGKYRTTFKNDFGEELQWSNSNKITKISVSNYKDLPKLTFFSEFLEEYKSIL
ncbi:hypothetical protein [Flavobacterium sp. PL002]|uniref:hypothetical protein n=1 Tax=Flavobacterium sp. PL002 TaxID=1897058 RepID=UPI001787E680|nr:hypothetical protein [Flavobacterium sp. PL002]MBE0393892.1 hypothetical protein [Flavobacterium sp. PL002]